MAKSYNCPSWSALPVDEMFLEVLKDGSIIDRIDLGPSKMKATFILGRQPDLVDILVEHPSLSRQHAILQYRDDGALMLLDFQSAQGTFLNKVQLNPGQYHRLYVGDMFRLGASSRFYVVGGPDNHLRPEYDSENLHRYRQKLTELNALAAEKIANSNSCAWGFEEDAFDESYPDGDGNGNGDDEDLPEYLQKDENYNRKYGEKFKSSIKDSEVNEKDAAVLEKIQKLERKIQNMEEENRRIYLKENSQDGGLTSGQSAVITRNDERITQLKDEIDSLIGVIREKNLNRSNGGSTSADSFHAHKRKASEDSDDDMLDTTEQTVDTSTNWRLRKKLAKKGGVVGSNGGGSTLFGSTGTALTYELLVEEKVKRENQLAEISQKRERHQQLIDALVQSSSVSIGGDNADDDDGLDALMRENELKESRGIIKDIEREESILTNDLKQLENLIRIAKPALSSLKTKS